MKYPSRREALKSIGVLAGMAALPNLGLANSFQVNKRKILSSGEEIGCVGLGTWQTFDTGVSGYDPLREVLKMLVTHGGNLIDSSPMYGRSEAVVGQLTSELGIQKDLFTATKVWTSG